MANASVYSASQWSPNILGYYSISLASRLFGYQGASKGYSITAPDANTVRFELHDGDQHVWDAKMGHTSERDELASRDIVANNGTPIHVSYGFTLEKGAANTADWMVLGQLHQDLDATGPGSPPFAVTLVGEHMVIDARYTGADGKQVAMALYTDPYEIDRGHQYQMDIKTVMDPSGKAGRLVVTRDGVTIVDYSGPLGDPSMKGVYWAEGVYRSGNATETAAADYSNLSIQTGSAVTFPDKSAFIAAPSFAVSSATAAIGAAASIAGGAYRVTLDGTTAANATVTVYENKVAVGTATADASGHVAMTVQVSGTGTHALYSVATDAAGRAGITSNALNVVVGTSASIVAQLDTLGKAPGLGAVVLTDSHILNVANAADLGRFIHYTDLMAKIDGGAVFRIDEKVAGSGFDEQVRTLAADGTTLTVQRYLAGKLVTDTSYSGADAVTRGYSADGTSSVSHFVGGKLQLVENFAASGVETSKQVLYGDGGKAFTYFDGHGAIAKVVAYATDNSRVETSYGVTGQAYVSQAFAFDASGKAVSQARYDAAGHVVFAGDLTKGTVTSYSYAGNGALSSYRMQNGDGSYSVTTLAADGAGIARTIYYSAKGAMLKQDVSDPAPLSAVGVTAASRSILASEAKNAPLVETAALGASKVAIAATTDAAAHVVVSGTGKIGSEVAILDGTTEVGRAIVDGTGHLSLTISGAAAGSHSYSAVQLDGPHDASNVATVIVAAPAANGAATTPGLGAPSGSGSGAITTPVASPAPAPIVNAGNGTALSSADAMTLGYGKLIDLQNAIRIGGAALDGRLLKLTEAVSSSAYDHQTRTFDSTGAVVQLERMSKGVQTMSQTTHDQVIVTRSVIADGSSAVSEIVAGKLAANQSFDASGHLVATQTRFADGWVRNEAVSATTGATTSAIVYATDGSRLEWTYGVTGKSYVSQVFERAATGGLSYNARYDAAGHVVFASDLKSGTGTDYSYDASGNAISHRTVLTNGTYSVTTLAADHATVAGTDYFSNKGKLLGHDTSDPAAATLKAITGYVAAAAGHPQTAGSLVGGDHADTATAGAGSTLLWGGGGSDVLIGGAGNDVLIGGSGADVMTGGGGHDLFWFGPNDFGATSGTAGADRITDFEQGDRIDLSALENLVKGHVGLNFIGTGDFTGAAGQVHSFEVGGNTYVSGDLDGDKLADFTIQLDGHHAMTSANLYL